MVSEALLGLVLAMGSMTKSEVEAAIVLGPVLEFLLKMGPRMVSEMVIW